MPLLKFQPSYTMKSTHDTNFLSISTACSLDRFFIFTRVDQTRPNSVFAYEVRLVGRQWSLACRKMSLLHKINQNSASPVTLYMRGQKQGIVCSSCCLNLAYYVSSTGSLFKANTHTHTHTHTL